VLVLIERAARLQVNVQAPVHLQDSLTDVLSLSHEEIACQKDSAPHSSFLAVHVHLALLLESRFDLSNCLDEFEEREAAVKLEVEMVHLAVGVTLQQ
jgi:hypothetical protein